ncbi:MAG: putative methyltransferase [Candidatus Saccharibacteria bacterium]|nr:putative methyltransferase [Candidatus Saccharibacteria bacterium]
MKLSISSLFSRLPVMRKLLLGNNHLFAHKHNLDQFYIDFEERFRGSENEIKDRLRVYLPYLGESPVLDLGSGRGELLQLVQEAGITGRGVDLNKHMVERAKGKGLDVVQADIMEFVAKQPADSFATVTAIHVVEHVPFEDLFALSRECYRILKPGGYLIFETPNPENLIVGAHDFYQDPSHLHPLPPSLTEFLLQHHGFRKTIIQRFRPMRKELQSKDQLLTDTAQHLFGPADYAIIAQK